MTGIFLSVVKAMKQTGTATLLMGFALLIASVPAQAQSDSLSIKSSFRIGSAGVVCNAQYSPGDGRLKSMFDRAYQIVCRDAAAPVGSLVVLRNDHATPLSDTLLQQAAGLKCGVPQKSSLKNFGDTVSLDCFDSDQSVDRKLYAAKQGQKVFFAEGLKGYDSALQLGLASLLKDRLVDGNVDVATTSLSDPAAFARIRAGQLGAGAARKQAYRLNNSGSFSEASAFFEALSNDKTDSSDRNAEFLANRGLQQSNLGNYLAANSLFGQALKAVPSTDGVTQRLIRNFKAIDYLNQNLPSPALDALDRTVAPIIDNSLDEGLADGIITGPLAEQINRENRNLKTLGAVDSGLTDEEIAVILDGQADQIRGSALRLQLDYDGASNALSAAIAALSSVRNGRVLSVAWLMMEARYELGLVSEAQGRFEQAEDAFQNAVLFAEQTYPQSPAVLTAKARLAAYLARQNRNDESIALFDTIVTESEAIPAAGASMKNLLAPYFRLLGNRFATDPSVGEKLFYATQLLQRPGVAQTQAVFARELSEGDDEAAALFRLAVSRTRAIARTAADVGRLSSIAELSETEAATLAEAEASLINLQQEQTALQSRLADFSQYRVLSSNRLDFDELQKLLQPGEGYYKVSMINGRAYGQLIMRDGLRSVLIPSSVLQLSEMVEALRDSIVVIENGVPVTYPFDVTIARQLYLSLFGQLEEELKQIDHLIYEPDGALLQLPPTLLITKQKPVDAYLERIEEPDADAFDFTEIDWLGREMSLSIAVSQRAFADIRNLKSAKASKKYLGLGQNAEPAPTFRDISQSGNAAEDECAWPLSTWQNPIAPDELYLAQNVLGRDQSDVVTKAGFSDSELLKRNDLNDYKIVHFATHGLVTAPRPQCPARPALVTSFGDEESDGLLSFKEIFDLRLDADLVILSACDTAGIATAAASREAGIATGGDYALDGLVRAFVGAGARSVLASHWPVPDDFDATKTLISGIFSTEKAMSIGQSLSRTQHKMMDDPLTSHPYYWAAFVLVGDGAKNIFD